MRTFPSIITLLLLSVSFSQTTINGSFMHNGLTRTYSFYVPAIYDGTVAYPLILNLHGYTSNGSEQSIYGNFKPIADTAGFIVVHPEGTIQTGTASTQFWNVGLFPSNVDDVAFLEALIDTISASYTIDHSRVYSTGMSNGGFMSYKLACESNRFAAIASVTGGVTNSMQNNCFPSRPTPIMEIHGTADPIVPYNGQTGILSIDNVLSLWIGLNGCNTTPTMTQVPDSETTDGATAEHYVYTAGTNNATIEHYKILNGGHTWPGAPVVLGVTCMDFSASKEIWRFFSQYSNPSVSLNAVTKQTIKCYPNPFSEQIMIDAGEEQIESVTLTKLSGEELPINLEYNCISTYHLSDGMYLLTLRSSQGSQKLKILKRSEE